MTASARTELLNIQKRLFRRNRRVIEGSILVKEPQFDRYERAYRRQVARYQKISSHEEMLQAVLKANIAYVGDYHTCNQSQRSFLRILKAVVKKDPHLIIGLELIHARYKKELDGYLYSRISEQTFLKRIKLQEHWVYDLWENFKPIFDFCRYHEIPMVAIDA